MSVGEDREEGVGEHGYGDMSIPGRIEADLVIAEPDVALTSLKALLDGPPRSRDANEFAGGFTAGVVTVVEGELAVVDEPVTIPV